MSYTITLILKKQVDSRALPEIKQYIEKKEGKILVVNESGEAKLNPSKKATESKIVKLEITVSPAEIEKIKDKINHEKEVVSYILEKKKIFKKIEKKEKERRKKPHKAGPAPISTSAVSRSKKEESDKAGKILDSMQEEEKKIKDLDSTLDKILNE